MRELKILGLFGPAGSGKDLVADWFVDQKGFSKVAFADPMKRFAKQAFDLSTDQLWGPSETRNQEFLIDDRWWFDVIGGFSDAANEIINAVLELGYRTQGFLKLYDWLTWLRKEYPEKISPRVILQTLGTEWGRTIDPLMWVKYAYLMIDNLALGNFYTQTEGLRERRPGEVSVYPGVIIPDHRFLNEIEETQTRGNYVMRLRRLALEKKDESVGIVGHESEAGQKTISDGVFDTVLEFEEGLDKVHQLLEKTYAEESWKMRRMSNRS